MPPLTSADVLDGLIGLIVVRARRNESWAVARTEKPARTRASAPAMRCTVGNGSAGVAAATAHMSSATTSATTGGGTFSSSTLTGLRGITFDMSGGTKWAKPALGRPLDGGVMPHSHRRTLPLYDAYSGPKSNDNARSS